MNRMPNKLAYVGVCVMIAVAYFQVFEPAVGDCWDLWAWTSPLWWVEQDEQSSGLNCGETTLVAIMESSSSFTPLFTSQFLPLKSSFHEYQRSQEKIVHKNFIFQYICQKRVD